MPATDYSKPATRTEKIAALAAHIITACVMLGGLVYTVAA